MQTWVPSKLQQILFLTSESSPIPLYADNMSMIQIATNPIFNEQIK